MRIPITRAVRGTASVSSRTTFIRSYAAKKDMSATQGQASPGTASNVGNPVSASPEAQDVNTSRADYGASPDTKSVSQPVSNPSGASTGQQEADSSTHQAFKQDPDAPASEKRKNVDQQGQKPLDAADK